MTRLGRVEVYRHKARQWARTCGLEYQISWGWRHYAANGVQIGGSTESYNRLRDLSHNLEQCFPGYKLLDQDGGLVGPDWFLYGLQATCDEAYLTVPEDLTLGMGMRGVRIPVATPVNLASRVRR